MNNPANRRPSFSTLLLLLGLTLIPGCLLAESPPLDEPPYVAEFAEGWIDWRDGIIYGVAEVPLKSQGGSKLKALRVAQAIARGNIIKIAGRIRLDASDRIESLGDGRVVQVLRALIKDEQVESRLQDAADGQVYRVVQKASIRGVEGLTRLILPELDNLGWLERRIDYRPGEREVPHEENEESHWLVLDARGLQGRTINPALFPEIRDRSGRRIYHYSMLDAQILVERGMMRYVQSDKPLSEVSGRGADDAELAWLWGLLGIGTAEAAEPDVRRRGSRGRVILTKVEETGGLAKTNLVISDRDADKLMEGGGDVLKNARVVVLMPGSVAAIEGVAPSALEVAVLK